MMGDDKSVGVMGNSSRERDRELLIPVADSVDRRLDDDATSSSSSKPSPSASSSHHNSGREIVSIFVHPGHPADILQSCEELGVKEIHDWMICHLVCMCMTCKDFKVETEAVKILRKTWMLVTLLEFLFRPPFTRGLSFLLLLLLTLSFCSVILFPIAITFYITWWFIHFVDGFFSPIYAQLGIDIFGLGFVTSITFIFLVGVFMSSWLGTSVLSLGEWFIKRMPFVRHIYNASKQISAAISPDQNTQAFKEVAIIRHPRIGEYAFGFITSSVTLQNYSGEEELCCVYVPTNHLYIGDIFLVNAEDVIRPNLSVREGIEIVVSGGMSMPQILSTLDPRAIQVDRIRPVRS
ncbi:hypothetical protein BUALT_Bualt09G0021400 [Buddleja alternifolia]|uniref:Uncharacterized protein n=1 Tax=Buddleja alternifolia TaxID=168488 RepID=A0AAV6WYH0_9LAMI|nr:hypothetical protein BUALT_Bualt09G0021400 [Buddleja alternifolia]